MLYTTKKGAMNALKDAARLGYIYSISGCVNAEKMPDMVKRFTERFDVKIPRQTRHNRRKAGQPVYVLVLYPANESGSMPQGFEWWLLTTDKSKVTDEEWKAVTQDKLLMGSQYEMVRETKPGADRATWTWRMTKETLDDWRDTLHRTVAHKHDKKLEDVVFMNIASMPNQCGIRRQKNLLRAAYNKSWRMHRKSSEEKPRFPFNHWHRFEVRPTVTNLRQFVTQMMKHDRSAAEQMRVYNANTKKRGRAA